MRPVDLPRRAPWCPGVRARSMMSCAVMSNSIDRSPSHLAPVPIRRRFQRCSRAEQPVVMKSQLARPMHCRRVPFANSAVRPKQSLTSMTTCFVGCGRDRRHQHKIRLIAHMMKAMRREWHWRAVRLLHTLQSRRPVSNFRLAVATARRNRISPRCRWPIHALLAVSHRAERSLVGR